MTIARLLVCLVLAAGAWEGAALPHHLRHHSGELKALAELAEPKLRSLQPPHPRNESAAAAGAGGELGIPYSYKKLDKMMKKAILQIILGELHPADMLLLKALNYSLEEVMAIRQHELARAKEAAEEEEDEQQPESEDERPTEEQQPEYQAPVRRRSSPGRRKPGPSSGSLEAYNRQAVYDYENGRPEEQRSGEERDAVRRSFDRGMEPHVVFKIRYDDSEFDSGSEERPRGLPRAKNLGGDSFQAPGGDAAGGAAAAAAAAGAAPGVEEATSGTADNSLAEQAAREFASHEEFQRALNGSSGEEATLQPRLEEKRRVSEYEGLEWVGGDVYRVVPEAMEALLNYEDPLEAEEEEAARNNSSYASGTEEIANDTSEYQNDQLGQTQLGDAGDGQNLTSYQRLAQAQRRDQSQKAIEDIKLRVLALTGRFNLSSSSNQVQRERLTMFSPTCQMPRNTDAEAWGDPFSMNMHFQLNLTSGEHVLAAKLRLFKLPQDVAAHPSTAGGTYEEEEEEDEKKIRVSVYFYTKSLKKHRAKKRLMDSVVTPLTAQGSHLALDVRQSLRFWRPADGQHSSNHGLVVQVEDQDGKPLKPALYIQESSCRSGSGTDADEKAYQYQYVPALFVRACTRYVRIVNGQREMYVQCRPSQRH